MVAHPKYSKMVILEEHVRIMFPMIIKLIKKSKETKLNKSHK